MIEITRTGPRNSSMAFEFALLVLLATLWGESYTFIKLGVAAMTIPERKPADMA
jgi:hypothetical protein